MGRLEAIKIFTRVAESNSFSKTADAMDIPRGSVSRTIQSLEEQLGVRLLSRSTRQVHLTEAGKLYYERCVRVLSDLSEIEGELTSMRTQPNGTVRIDTSATIAKVLIVPLLDDFFARYPDIDIRIGIADRNIDLIQEGVDCVLRMGALEESSLVAKRIGSAKLVTCAAPQYLQIRGTPVSLANLTDHCAVNYTSARTGRLLPFEFDQDGQIVKLTLKSRLVVNEGNAYIDAGVRGYGIIQPSRCLVAELLNQGLLREIMTEYRSPPIPLSLVFSHRKHISSATRAFAEWITELCRQNPDLGI
jgi:LysR family transcriptional regulator for bpeEF and oprC